MGRANRINFVGGWGETGLPFSLLTRSLVSHQPPHVFRALLFSIRSSLRVSHKTGYATRQDELNPPRDWDWIGKRICKTIVVNSGLLFANFACACKSAVLLKRTINQIQGLLSNLFSDFPKTTERKGIQEHARYLYSTANDPQQQMIPRPQMILDRKWSPKLTANDPERKIGMA